MLEPPKGQIKICTVTHVAVYCIKAVICIRNGDGLVRDPCLFQRSIQLISLFRGDDYITRSDDFKQPAQTMDFIRRQVANGGGDLPEAVHSALEKALSDLSWNESARTRMAFLILDAPAHLDHDGVVASLQKSIQAFANRGIRIIPVLASTGDKTTEFMCRDFAIVTGGTYVFLTDDSQVGESHIVPSVGEYAVEKLNDLLCRLIEDYIS